MGDMEKILKLIFKGWDSWDRPVYVDDEGNVYCDVDPRSNREPDIHTKCNNEFDGEPDSRVSCEINFVGKRMTW